MNSLTLDIPIGLSALAEAQDRAEAWAEAAGVPAQATLRLRLVVEELVANLVEHAAWPGPPVAARLHLSWQDGTLRGVLEDSAVPFDPLALREAPSEAPGPERIGGLGLALVRRMTAALVYGPAATPGWNRTDFIIRLG
ncbi:ATP-binding protein [Falsiroseomonas selenitidurans]|uniref:ATP-binding protein n=1 Tax=Falsiroseomonas selenitidurans TaxID=2716335 RepID=A0ABX1E120_9PROT|nr:ATP-binding protein [Falsiroseomonas selenitidurans]NKC30844.1 ATP-binding protein [Falsiroseomonas selenitidurans]